MDHNNSDGKKCSCGGNCGKKHCDCSRGGVVSEKKYCMCPHGRCKDHNPEWKNAGKAFLSRNPGIFGAKTYWLSRCCGKGMARYQKVQMQLCAKCGRTRIEILVKEVALCECCGYHRNFKTDDFDDFGLIP